MTYYDVIAFKYKVTCCDVVTDIRHPDVNHATHLVADETVQHTHDGGALAIRDIVKNLVHLVRVTDRHLKNGVKKLRRIQ